MRPPLSNQDGVEKWTSVSTFSNTDLNGNQNQQCPNLGPSDTTSIKAKPKIEKKKDKNGAEKSTRKFYTVAIMH